MFLMFELSFTAVVLLTVVSTNPVAPLLTPFTNEVAGHSRGLMLRLQLNQ